MKKLIHHIRKSFNTATFQHRGRKIERNESHLSRAQTSKILTIGFFFLLGYMMLVPPTPKTDTTTEQLVFQFRGSASDWGIEEIAMHGAADRRGYLFDGANNEKTFSGSVTSTATATTTGKTDITTPPSLGIQATVTNVNAPAKYAKIIDEIIIPNYYVADETLIFSSDLAIYYLEHFLEGDRTKLFATTDGYQPKDCLSPSGNDVITHGDFIIAYQQRSDVSDICNVEKRYCNDGTLLGSYTQTSCEEKTSYEYEKVIPTSENEFIPNEYIQPSDPENANATFDNQGKINGQLEPTTRWETEPANAQTVNNSGVVQTMVATKNCRTPRGEKVLNNQFVRAYKTKQGYFNRPCEVEIRMCMNGKLKGAFKSKSCSYTGVSYEMANGIN